GGIRQAGDRRGSRRRGGDRLPPRLARGSGGGGRQDLARVAARPGAAQPLGRGRNRGAHPEGQAPLSDRQSRHDSRGGRKERVGRTRAPVDYRNLADMFFHRAADFAGKPRYIVKREGRWVECLWDEHARAVLEIAVGLFAAGLSPGGKVALLSGTRPEWI